MRKLFLSLGLVVALFVSGSVALQCGDACGSSSDCADAGTCRLCIDGTCQHRCMLEQAVSDNFLVGSAQCGDACASSGDCASAATCRICIDGTCQHRCAFEEVITQPVKAA